ncbi:MAG: histidine kinase [Bacteroidota bacterium]
MDAQENKLFITILIAGVFIGIIIFLFIRFIIKHQKTNSIRHKSEVETEIATLEKERNRISRDFHDELGPLLSGIRFKVSALEVEAEDDKRLVKDLFADLDTMMQRLRDITGNLVPASLEYGGLYAAIDQFIATTRRNSDLDIRLELPAGRPPRHESDIHIYRVIQEITHNTIKHADATLLSIELTTEPGKLILRTTDNGKGFSFNRNDPNQQGNGLRSILSRTSQFQGEIFMEPAAPNGISYLIEIPLKHYE